MEHFELISSYFHTGMNYNDILKALAARHGVALSKRCLIRLGSAWKIVYLFYGIMSWKVKTQNKYMMISLCYIQILLFI